MGLNFSGSGNSDSSRDMDLENVSLAEACPKNALMDVAIYHSSGWRTLPAGI